MSLLQYIGIFLCSLFSESEIVARRGSIKNRFLKIEQNSQVCARVFFFFAIKLHLEGLQLY